MKLINGKPMRELRCMKCRALLCNEYIYAGRMSIKCYNCNEIYNIEFRSAKAELKTAKEVNN